MITASQILTATDQRIVEIGTDFSKRLTDGKQSKYDTMAKLVLLKKAYNNPELTEDERESILYCLLRLSNKFDVPSNLNSGGLGLNPIVVGKPSPTLYLVGAGDDVTDYWGTGNDISDYL